MRFDLDRFAGDALDRKAAAVDRGQHRIDDCTHSALDRLGLSHWVRNAERWSPAAAD